MATQTASAQRATGWQSGRTILADAWSKWNEHRAPQMGAALAFYAVFSLGPMLLLAMGVASLLFEADAVESHVYSQLDDMLGNDGRAGVVTMLEGARQEGSGVLATVIGVAVSLLAAAGVFGQLQESMNTVWETPARAGSGVWNFIRTRFLSFSMVLGIGFLLLVSLLMHSFLHAFSGMLEAWAPGLAAVIYVAGIVTSIIMVWLFFALVFKLLPDTDVAWNDVWLGAFLTALLFALGKVLLGMYLGRAGFSTSYGAAGALMIVLMWTYYSAQILLFGAEFTRAYAKQRGSLKPA